MRDTVDVWRCAINAVLSVLWMWFWYGIVSWFLGEPVGFIAVIVMVFINNVTKEVRGIRTKEQR